MATPTDKKLQITGWLLFIASAMSFIVSTWRSGDLPGVIGSLCFLVACFVFLWPLVRDRN